MLHKIQKSWWYAVEDKGDKTIQFTEGGKIKSINDNHNSYFVIRIVNDIRCFPALLLFHKLLLEFIVNEKHEESKYDCGNNQYCVH